MGTNTDPYQPIEEHYQLTRQVLEVCLETRHPVTITTKSARVLRDLDLLGELARLNLTAVGISVTSLDPKLSGILEPRASSPAKRLDALGKLAAAGVPAHVSVAPVIPAITDEFHRRNPSGSRRAGRPLGQLDHAALAPRDWPRCSANGWMSTSPIAQPRSCTPSRRCATAGTTIPTFFARMKPEGVWADVFRTRFRLATKRLGMNEERTVLDSAQFVRPESGGQLRLF